jgi:hypothetical protein
MIVRAHVITVLIVLRLTQKCKKALVFWNSDRIFNKQSFGNVGESE